MIAGHEQPDDGHAARSARPWSSPTSTSRATRSIPTRPSGRRSPAATTRSRSATREMNSRAYVARLQLQGLRPAEEGRHALRRRAQPRAPREAAAAPAATCCCSTSRPTTSTSTRCARSRRRCSPSPAARWSSPTIAGSSTASPPTCSRSRATRRSTWFEGNFEAYEEHRRERLGDEADRPHRITYKKLTRA